MHGKSWKKEVESEAASKRRREMTAFFNANENDDWRGKSGAAGKRREHCWSGVHEQVR